ncbi:MFS transporter, partial [archaeon]
MKCTLYQSFSLLFFINLINFCDRGIIPGSYDEFSRFVQSAFDAPHISSSSSVGLLQSAFVIGIVIGFAGFGNAVHRVQGVFFLTGVGCSIWLLALVLSGLASYANSYVFLFVARMLSGIGEASLQCTVPPWIQIHAPSSSKGTYLAVFYTAMPVGIALGYAYSASMSHSVGWAWSYFVEALMMAPCITLLFCIDEQRINRDDGNSHSNNNYSNSHDNKRGGAWLDKNSEYEEVENAIIMQEMWVMEAVEETVQQHEPPDPL